MMKIQFLKPLVSGLLLSIFLFSCKKDNETPAPPKPSIHKVELGLGNNETGVIGEDFHFNAEVTAGDRIDTVIINIQQRSGTSYARVWSHEIRWEQYHGARNATIHKHFDIPEDAVEGKYDFIITVKDMNGAILRETRTLNVYLPENVPVLLTLVIFSISRNDAVFYRKGAFADGNNVKFTDRLWSQVTLDKIKGNGKMYLLLINKKLNHFPETIANIDFSKVIVYDVYEHKEVHESGSFSNVVFDIGTFSFLRQAPELVIGAEKDNNLVPSPIGGPNAWESGAYEFRILYHNSTYNMNFLHKIDLNLQPE